MERFSLFLYLVGNGYDPVKAKNLILWAGKSYFDESAKSHLEYIYRHRDRYLRTYRIWDEFLNKYV